MLWCLDRLCRVPTLEGNAEVSVRPGTQPGNRLKMHGYGIPYVHQIGRKGDQYVLINVRLPREHEVRSWSFPSPGSELSMPRPSCAPCTPHCRTLCAGLQCWGDFTLIPCAAQCGAEAAAGGLQRGGAAEEEAGGMRGALASC